MIRYLTATLLAGLLVVALAGPVAAARPAVSGPACADISLEGFYWDDPDDTLGRIATLRITTADTVPTCERITYTFYVVTSAGEQSFSTTGDGVSTELGHIFQVTTDDEWICVSATSSRGGRVLDSAPDTNCGVLVFPTPPGGGSRWN